ncbi:MAG: FHA domain-containing protein [Myxococcota bacterium]
MPETLEDLLRKADRLGKEAFCARYPHPFMVRLDERGGVDEPSPWAFSTMASKLDVPRVPPAGPMAKAFELLKSSGKGGRDMISLGRTNNNDVVIPEMSVSKFHAFFKVAGDRNWQLVDAGSSNGTRVNGQKLAAKAPTPVQSGDTVVLGDVAFLFLWPEQLVEQLPSLCRPVG